MCEDKLSLDEYIQIESDESNGEERKEYRTEE